MRLYDTSTTFVAVIVLHFAMFFEREVWRIRSAAL